MQDLFEYTSKAHDLGRTVRFSKCPFCGKSVGRAGFIVTRTIKGHLMWCHSCHAKYFVPSGAPSLGQCLSLYSISSRRREGSTSLNSKLIKEKQANVCLPYDAKPALPVVAQIWLSKYGITQEEVHRHKFCWSASYQRLILPVYDTTGKLLYWQGRYFGSDKRQPKYLNISTDRKTVWFDTQVAHPSPVENVVVLVEDILSAIVLRRSGYRAIALLGSYVSDQLILNLLKESRQDMTVVVWLDPDKLCESIKSSRRIKTLGVSARSVLSCPHDPKECSSKEIRDKYMSWVKKEELVPNAIDIREEA